MEKKLTPELKAMKEKLTFLNNEICDLEWKLATIYYGRLGVLESEFDRLYEMLENYVAIKSHLIEDIKEAVSIQNKKDRIKKGQ